MEQIYSYRFHGSTDEFLEKTEKLRGRRACGLGDYLIEFDRMGKCRFGIGRTGHSSGYWYVPTIRETSQGTILEGKIEYIRPLLDVKDKLMVKKQKLTVKYVMRWLFYVVLITIFLVPLAIFLLGMTCWMKISLYFHKRKTSEKESISLKQIHEEKLDDLMMKWLGCDKLSGTENEIEG